MATFDEEQGKTTEKMADMVMEYVSQFIAHDYLEAYEEATKDETVLFVPSEFDDMIYKKISRQIKALGKYRYKLLRNIALAILGIACLLCVTFTIVVLADEVLRNQVLTNILSIK